MLPEQFDPEEKPDIDTLIKRQQPVESNFLSKHKKPPILQRTLIIKSFWKPPKTSVST